MARRDELPKRPACRAKRVELLDRKPAGLRGAPEIAELPRQLRHNARINRLVNSWTYHYIARVESNLPGVRRRDHHISADKFAPMHVISKSGGKQPDAISALFENLISLLEHRHTRPFKMSGLDGDVFLFRKHFQPIIESPDHNGANRTHGSNLFSFTFPSF